MPILSHAQPTAPALILRDRDAPFRRPAQSAAAQILELIDRRRPSLVTLDVFDTTLWRPCRTPSDLFSLVGDHFERRGLLKLGLAAASFGVARRQAEHLLRMEARRRMASIEIGLAAVYERLLPIFMPHAQDVASLVSMEVAVEQEALQPDITAQRVLEGLRSRGLPYAYVSDTYFTAAELAQLLRAADPTVTLDAIVSSHDEGLGKSLGLIAVAAQRFGALPTDVLHIGDNHDADVRGAKRIGATPVHVPQCRDIAAGTFNGEIQVARLLGVAWEEAPVRCGIDALRRQVWHETIGLQGKAELADELGLLTVGPLLAGFAEWTLREAVAAGIDTLLCLTREGLFLAELLNLFAERLDIPVRATPFLTSRAVTYPTLFSSLDVTEFETYFFGRRTPMSASTFLTRIGAPETVTEVPHGLRHLPIRRGDPAGAQILGLLAGSKRIRAAVAAWAERTRTDLARYLARIGGEAQLGQESRAAFVDLGWTTRSQTVLRNALRHIGGPEVLIGFYLATDEAAGAETAMGTLSRGFLFDMGAPRAECRVTLRCKEILEQVCSADVGSVEGYDAEGEVIFGAAAAPGPQHRFLAELRGRVRDFCTVYLDQVERNADRSAAWSLSLMVPALRLLLGRLTVVPSADELKLIGDWVHDENNGSTASETICDPYFVELARYATPRQIHRLPLYWVFGLLQLARPHAFDSVIAQSRGAAVQGDDIWQAARLHLIAAGVIVEDLGVDYSFASDGVAISHATFHHAGPLALHWVNYGDEPGVRVERVLVARRDALTGEMTRSVHLLPAEILDGEAGPDGAIIVAPGGSVSVLLPPHPGPCETSLVLCLRRLLH